jgi:hypothetical protein
MGKGKFHAFTLYPTSARSQSFPFYWEFLWQQDKKQDCVYNSRIKKSENNTQRLIEAI